MPKTRNRDTGAFVKPEVIIVIGLRAAGVSFFASSKAMVGVWEEQCVRVVGGRAGITEV